jgi:peptide/nickel transport system substrate-binding protein
MKAILIKEDCIMMVKKILSALVIGFSLVGGAVAQDKPVAGQVLNIAHPALSQTWSPLQGGGHAARWQSLMWAAPMYFDKAERCSRLVLAKAEPDANFVQWTLTINPKAVFSDGSPITAEDVKGTWDLCAMPSTKHQRADLFLGGIEGSRT